jgi:hypothetical protein
MRRVLALWMSLALPACLGTSGNAIVHFNAAAAGPNDAVAGSGLDFTSALGWHVVLTKATLHVGAMYLVQTLPSSGGGPSACVLEGTYVAEVTTDPGARAGIDVDLLSPTPQPFPNAGQGVDLGAKAGQVWLTGAPIDRESDPTNILQIEGTADRAGKSFPFKGQITISQNRVVKPTDSTKPGSEPICRQRIVSPILVDIVPHSGGTLLLRVDPRQLFVDVDFSALTAISTSPPLYAFSDDSSDAQSATLYSALHNAGALYQFSWRDSTP